MEPNSAIPSRAFKFQTVFPFRALPLRTDGRRIRWKAKPAEPGGEIEAGILSPRGEVAKKKNKRG